MEFDIIPDSIIYISIEDVSNMFLRFIRYLFKDLTIFTAAYSNQIFPDPLSKEEEEKYVELAQTGDKEARNLLIEHNLRLVAHIVKKYEHRKEDADDLISIGTIGLIKGVDSFSYKHGTRIKKRSQAHYILCKMY